MFVRVSGEQVWLAGTRWWSDGDHRRYFWGPEWCSARSRPSGGRMRGLMSIIMDVMG